MPTMEDLDWKGEETCTRIIDTIELHYEVCLGAKRGALTHIWVEWSKEFNGQLRQLSLIPDLPAKIREALTLINKYWWCRTRMLDVITGRLPGSEELEPGQGLVIQQTQIERIRQIRMTLMPSQQIVPRSNVNEPLVDAGMQL